MCIYIATITKSIFIIVLSKMANNNLTFNPDTRGDISLNQGSSSESGALVPDGGFTVPSLTGKSQYV